MSLAIVEAQRQRPASGCVGVMFLHLLDWNRSLAKKKKMKKKKKKNKPFSMRTVLPPLLNRTSNNPIPPSSPLLTSTSSEKRRESTVMVETNKSNTMGQPSLLARLMGLDSMPISTHHKPNKKSQKCNYSLLDDSNARPQKVQKTSNGSNPTPLKTHEQKMVSLSSRSPSRSPRARLVQAAAKLLEPGLRPKFSQSPLRSLSNVEDEYVTVGSLVETEFSETGDNLKLGSCEVNLEQETNIINKIEIEINNDAHLERKTKKKENTREIFKVNYCKNACNLVEKRPNVQKTERKQSITAKNSTLNKNSHTKGGKNICGKIKTEKRELRTEGGKSSSQRDAVKNNKTELNAVKSTRNNNRVSSKISSKTSVNEKINGDELSRSLTFSILDNIASDIEEEKYTYQKACFEGEMDQISSISILESTLNDSFSFNSPYNYLESKLSLNQTDKFDLGFLNSRLSCSHEITSNFELLFANILFSYHNPKIKYSVNGILLELLESVMEISSADITGEDKGYQLTNFMFDCIVECLDLKYRLLCKSGFKTWVLFSRFLSKDCLVREISEEIKEKSEIRGKGLDILAEKDLKNSNFKWFKFEFEGFEIGAEIEMDIIGSLVDEFVFDLC